MFVRSKAELADEHPFFDRPFLLASGMGRSGTTVLRNCIAGHPDIQCLNQESNYIFHLMRGANLHLDSEFDRKNLIVKEPVFWELHRQFVLSLLWPIESDFPPSKPKAIATYSKLDPRAAIGMTETFPKLSICLIVRNGIEVVSSYRAFDHFRHMTFEEVCRNWQFHSLITQYVRDQPHCTLIRYEWLQEDQPKFASALTSALKRIGLKFHPSCLDPLNEQFHPTTYAGETEADANDLTRRKDRWKHWTDDERDVFAELCGDTMESLGYSIPWRQV